MSFFFIFSSTLSILYAYTGFRLIPSLCSGKKKAGAWIVLILLYVCLILAFFFRTALRFPDLVSLLAWTGYSGLGLISYLFCLTLGRDLLIIPCVTFLRIKRFFFAQNKQMQPSPERRQFLYHASSAAIALMGGALAGAGTFLALKKPTIVRINIPLKKEHHLLKGLTLVQFTDLHIGPTIGYHYVEQVCDTIKNLKADIIVFTGDLADGSPQTLIHELSPLLALQAPLGKYFVTGNHEYYSGAERWIHQAKISGFEPLLNEHRTINYHNGLLTLAGVTDIQSHRFFPYHRSSPAAAIENAPQDSYKLLLAHHPTSIYQAASSGFDLQLSGHTHGGQYFPFEYAVGLQHPFIKGMYQYEKTQIYVNQGTGYWGPPLRLGTFPEITLFTFI
ncbi:MAG: metallophosphoesterase [Pseudomonadota bacterium]